MCRVISPRGCPDESGPWRLQGIPAHGGAVVTLRQTRHARTFLRTVQGIEYLHSLQKQIRCRRARPAGCGGGVAVLRGQRGHRRHLFGRDAQMMPQHRRNVGSPVLRGPLQRGRTGLRVIETRHHDHQIRALRIPSRSTPATGPALPYRPPSHTDLRTRHRPVHRRRARPEHHDRNRARARHIGPTERLAARRKPLRPGKIDSRADHAEAVTRLRPALRIPTRNTEIRTRVLLSYYGESYLPA